MPLLRPVLIVGLGLGCGAAALRAPCAAQTLPRLGLSGPEVGMDLPARPMPRNGAGDPAADAVIRQPRGAGRSRTLVLGEPEAIGRAAEAGEGGWPVDLRGARPPRSAHAEP